ncbi:bifunctional diaminohydroxyphosphoribosylaminopyrimidine deaminase/5-amino-6-(5-phosphoribosylamino)uracil reductase RibD [Ruania halotolerans]|uniref:bifunctional diaminohydroxyphosphoribosylaminopyrimidine deaminase/5-amino-6-(5-phosphoribosylamino)uracil reductase RibD n=1 Tax=Ruania halotolerans TaxID=2897773 RepID=UPI001E33E45A|nr:bifunctional diaminohydroxyphosphoribosylaminopyrimidine deaminase/5-amino-6-(5-phosphoribosylamino)uracil reductase RibD [Ruania halotolerans]UFU07022.1 bifunctional diaminohydroxyphosphoribosylaminopyrimidine deaminase/5-amino-6-(5-phosphoribosylamino)uracil reductase RibD [Ruania halotolerans]
MARPDGGTASGFFGDPDQVVAALRHAIELSVRGLGRVSPNPAVGCVILDIEGHVVGEGWHARAGGAHAEVAAIAAAHERVFGPGDPEVPGFLTGCTAVVTLEPCPHTGRTGPCTQALLDAGISRVIYAVADPSHGGGAEVLRTAGIEVHGPGSALVPDAFAAEAASVNEAWLTAVRTSRPHVTWKFAATLDGRSAAADGTSRWITGEQARADVHRLRDSVDAVLIGARTQRTDDPQLTVRPAPPDGRQPLRVVLDPSGATASGARVLDDAAPTLLVIGPDTPTPDLPGHVEIARAPTAPPPAELRSESGLERTTTWPDRGHEQDLTGPGEGRSDHRYLDLAAVLDLLYHRGFRSVLLEGGPRLAGAFLAAGLVDQVIAYLAPALLGAGPAALADAGVATIDAAHRLEPVDVTFLGPDIRITARPIPLPESLQE